MRSQPKNQKIVVGISGGVDSSVAAYLLKKATPNNFSKLFGRPTPKGFRGYEVIGVFVKTWSPEWLPCTWIDEKRDAMRVCAALDIPFHFLDAEEAYKNGVAEYMIAEYRAGRTPNPDVLCNRVIKFGVLWDYAKSLGAEAIATGHYAQTDGARLMRGADQSKDQSYFLWMLEKKELAHMRFPIGHLQKSEVRAIAEKAGLFTSVKKDSQGICFLGDVDMREFLSHYIEQKKGEVVDEQGTVIGEHDGVWFSTIGERRGFRITSKDNRRGAHYVIGKDIERNRLVVATSPSVTGEQQGSVTVTLREANWIVPMKKNKRYQAQIRYHGTLIDANIIDGATIRLSHDGALPLGQSLVLYEGETLVAGGIVDAVE